MGDICVLISISFNWNGLNFNTTQFNLITSGIENISVLSGDSFTFYFKNKFCIVLHKNENLYVKNYDKHLRWLHASHN